MDTWEKRSDINPIVWNAKMAELYSIFRGHLQNAASARVNQANLELGPLGMSKICVGISQERPF
jgi:hypothetical protein